MKFGWQFRNSFGHGIEPTVVPSSCARGSFERPWITSETFNFWKLSRNLKKLSIWHPKFFPDFSKFKIEKCNHSQLQLSFIVQKRLVSGDLRTSHLFFSLTCFKPSNLYCEVINIYITKIDSVCMTLITRHSYYARSKLVTLVHNRIVGDFYILPLISFIGAI